MRKVKRWDLVILAGIVLLLIFGPSSASGNVTGTLPGAAPEDGIGGNFSPVKFQDGRPVLYFFFNRNCAECLKTLPYIEEFQRTNPGVVVHFIDIREDEGNLALFSAFREYYGTGFLPVPTVFVGNESLSGYDEITAGLPDAVSRAGEDPGEGQEPAPGGSQGSTLTVPLVIMAALADGINPCAFAVLIFLILSLLSLESRRRMLIVGAVFITAVFCFYFLSGIGIFAVIQSAGISRMISYAAAAIAIAAGVISILSVMGGAQGPPLLSIPERGKGIIERYVRKATLPAAFLLGILVGMFELPCTGGIYLAILSLLSNRMSMADGIPYLLLYNLFFILPLVIILGVFVFGLPVERLEELHARSRRGIRVIMGAVMILLGIILLIELW